MAIEIVRGGRLLWLTDTFSVWLPDYVACGFMLAGFLFASAYLASRLRATGQ